MIKKKDKTMINKIKEALEKGEDNKATNSMGCFERYYNKYCLVGSCFENDLTVLEQMSEKELSNLLKLAGFASDCFY